MLSRAFEGSKASGKETAVDADLEKSMRKREQRSKIFY